MAVNFRPAALIDLVFIQSCAKAAYTKYVERMGKEPAPMIADFASSISLGHIEIMNIDGMPSGYLVSYAREDHLFVENIAIHPTHQGKRLARSMFQHLETKAVSAGLTALELYTNEKMIENLGLYARLGFTETDRRTENGFSRVYFRKNLSPD